jgi:hypothetical protein
VLALMSGAYRMSKRLAQTFCADVFGIPICAGQIFSCEAETAAATNAVVQELRAYACNQPANIEETDRREFRELTDQLAEPPRSPAGRAPRAKGAKP